MNRSLRKFIWIVVVILSLLFISFPFILNLFTDKQKLKTMHNSETFDGLVLNIKICIFSNNPSGIISDEWILNNCDNVDNFNCDNVNYENNKLTLKNCLINDQLFSYENEKIEAIN